MKKKQTKEEKPMKESRVGTCFFTYGGKIIGHTYILEKSEQ
jgi:hypothetical protein